jgi:ABC-type sugar transport system ATPase subunit
MAQVVIRNLNKTFDGVHAVKDVNLEINDKEFVVLVGPSGCGKTTTLRMVAGLESITSGEILIGDKIVNELPPMDRDIAMVFQNYALYPHMNVYDNMAFGLKMRRFGRAEIDARVTAAAEILGIQAQLQRKPRQLSGGQRQRVALARALVNGPKALLLDEPLGALDLKLREQMQEELKTLQKQLGITFVFVTHDQGEALSMADRVAVFNEGKIVQVDSPAKVYERPQSRFVADFVGSSNVLPPDFAADHGCSAKWTSLRPERIAVVAPGAAIPEGHLSADGEVKLISYQGAVMRFSVQAGDRRIAAEVPAGAEFKEGDKVRLIWPKSAMVTMDSA